MYLKGWDYLRGPRGFYLSQPEIPLSSVGLMGNKRLLSENLIPTKGMQQIVGLDVVERGYFFYGTPERERERNGREAVQLKGNMKNHQQDKANTKRGNDQKVKY